MTLLGVLMKRALRRPASARPCPECGARGAVQACSGARRVLVCLRCGHVRADPLT